MQSTENVPVAPTPGRIEEWLDTMRAEHARGDHVQHQYVTCPSCTPIDTGNIGRFREYLSREMRSRD